MFSQIFLHHLMDEQYVDVMDKEQKSFSTSPTSLTVSCVCAAESVKDLIRYLRHEDDTRDVRQQLGSGQIVQNDLLPLITQHGQDKPLFDGCIR